MRRILVMGDFHIPSRARWIPRPILEFLVGKRFDLVLCTGDLCTDEVQQFLSRFGPLVCVMGNMDYIHNPREFRHKIEDLVIGMRHGDEVRPRGDIEGLRTLAIRMGVDVLITGHTHVPMVKELKVRDRKILLLNPGSATGVWSGGLEHGPPSFMILEVDGNKLTVHLYKLVGEELQEETYEFVKE